MGSSRSPMRGEAASPMPYAPDAPGIRSHASTWMRAFRKRGTGDSPIGSLGRTPADQMMVAQPGGVLQRLQSKGDSGHLLVAEVVVGAASREHQVVVAQWRTAIELHHLSH